jgi:carbon-monoxide dehydrogenase medium subunit
MALAMAAELEIVGSNGTRRVPADDYFIDLFQTAMEPGELLVAIHVPIMGQRHRWAFDELARRRGDYAIVGCGMLAEFAGDQIDNIRIAFFSVGNTPLRARQTEAALIGRSLVQVTIAEAQSRVADDLSPPDDEQVPANMRIHLARVLTGRLLGRMMEAV